MRKKKGKGTGNKTQADLQIAVFQRHRYHVLLNRLNEEWKAYNQDKNINKFPTLSEQVAKRKSTHSAQDKPSIPTNMEPAPRISQPNQNLTSIPEAQTSKHKVQLNFEKSKLLDPTAGAAETANSRACFVAIVDAMSQLGFQFPFTPENLMRHISSRDIVNHPNLSPKNLTRDPQGNPPKVWIEYELRNPILKPGAIKYEFQVILGALNNYSDIFQTLQGRLTSNGQPLTPDQFFNLFCKVGIRNDLARRLTDPQKNPDSLTELALEMMRYAVPPANINNPEQFLREIALVP